MELINYTIGEIAKEVKLSAATLRHYEKKGLITPNAKTNAGYRLYNFHDVRRILFIKRAQSHGLSLSDIKELLLIMQNKSESCQQLHELMIQRKRILDNEIKTMEFIRKGLNSLIDKCMGGMTIRDCSIVRTLKSNREIEVKNG